MAIWGDILFQEGHTVRGLAFLTASLDRCPANECGWMQQLQEQAFSVANEEDRRGAVALSQELASVIASLLRHLFLGSAMPGVKSVWLLRNQTRRTWARGRRALDPEGEG